jgi:hypothetical protein
MKDLPPQAVEIVRFLAIDGSAIQQSVILVDLDLFT